MSIQRRLLLSMIAIIVAGIALTAGIVYRQAREEANDLFDLQLKQFAAALPVRVFGGLAPQAPNAPEAQDDMVIRIWNRVGVFVYSSHPEVPLPGTAQIGLSTVATAAGDWRVFAAQIDDQLLEVAQPMRVRSRLAAQVALRTVLPLVILLPILAGLMWWVVGRGLAPLRRVADEVAARRPEALERISEDALPEEVVPLVASLNRLLADLVGARDAQRGFIADAAHELRTPLTALQLQLQVAERAGDPAARAAALAALKEGLARAARLVEQLLTLARAEPDGAARGTTFPTDRVDLRALVRESIAAHAHLALDRGIDLGTDVDETGALAVEGDHDALYTLLGNLVDNALRYTPRGGRVDVHVTTEGETDAGRIVLSVEDDGPGIVAAERERVFDRFHRGDAARSTADTHGSGLGLAIVKRIAERHRAQVSLDAPARGNGLAVRVTFPRPVGAETAAANT